MTGYIKTIARFGGNVNPSQQFYKQRTKMNHNHKYIYFKDINKIYEAKFDGKSWIIYHLENGQRCLNDWRVCVPAKTLRKSLLQTFSKFYKPKIYDNLQTLMEKETHNLL